MKKIIHNLQDNQAEYNKTIASINAVTGNITQEKALKAIVNTEEIAKVWNKIGHADKKHKSGSISSLQIQVTWISDDCDEDKISALNNPKKAQHWKTVKTPQEIAFYLKLRN
eukprot:10116255-Ditylum_brightwellii.AAC.1